MNSGHSTPSGANAKRQGHESEAEGSPASKLEETNVPAKTDNPMMVFKGGDQGWLSLKLESAEPVNHNTKRLRFHLPEEESVSGLAVACKAVFLCVRIRNCCRALTCDSCFVDEV